MYEKQVKEFLDSFDGSLAEHRAKRVDKFLKDICHEYSFEDSQLSDTMELLFMIFHRENTPENMAEAVSLLDRILDAGKAPEKGRGARMDRFCIKHLFPAIYDLNAGQPVTDRLLFMQPRQGLNESFRYLYRKLQREYSYPLALYELHRDDLTKTGYYVNTAWFMRDMATARVVFVHESNNLMGYLNIRPETSIVQLWHGCGVFKHIGLSTIGKKGFKSMARYEEFPEYNKYSVVTIASPELTWVFEEFMGISKESGVIQPLGVCRTDEIFDDGYVDTCYQKLYKAIPAARGKKIILYAPTYRGVDPNRVSPDALDIAKFAEELGDDYILIMKHHQTVREVAEIPEPYRDTFAYDMTRGRGMNINELMTIADICITDYSSVAFEFSVFERPLLFFVYDLDEYIDNRGLYYDFDEITPGPLCRTNEEMIRYIREIRQGFDKSVITDFKNRFMCGCDGHACERVIHLLGLDGEKEAAGQKYTDGKEKEPVKEPGNQSKRLVVYSCDDDRLETTVSFEAGDALQLRKNTFSHAYDGFAGWNLYQYGGDGRIWLCEDGSWHTGAELKTLSIEKKLLRDEAILQDFVPWNDFAIYLTAQWKMKPSAKSVMRHTKAYCKRILKAVRRRLPHIK